MVSFQKKLLLLFVLSLSTFANVYAQYEDSFYVWKWNSGEKETLPKWIFEARDNGLVLAVSDPCLKPEIARQQAISRAIYLHVLQSNMDLRLVLEYFSSTQSMTNAHDNVGSKIISMGHLTHPASNNYSCEIVEEYVSKFGELYILAAVTPTTQDISDDVYSFISDSEFMMLIVNDGLESHEMKLKMQMRMEKSTETSTSEYHLKGKTNNPVIDSYLNNIVLPHTGYECWFMPSNTINEQYIGSSMSLKGSFWSAYISSLLIQVLNYEYPNVKIKHLSERFDNTNKTSELARELVTQQISAVPQIKGVRENRLYIDWKITSINN